MKNWNMCVWICRFGTELSNRQFCKCPSCNDTQFWSHCRSCLVCFSHLYDYQWLPVSGWASEWVSRNKSQFSFVTYIYVSDCYPTGWPYRCRKHSDCGPGFLCKKTSVERTRCGCFGYAHVGIAQGRRRWFPPQDDAVFNSKWPAASSPENLS